MEDPGGGFNFDFVLEMLKRDTLKPVTLIKSPFVAARNARIVFRKFGTISEPGVFNPYNFEIKDLDLNLLQLEVRGDSLAFNIRNSSLEESSGLTLLLMMLWS